MSRRVPVTISCAKCGNEYTPPRSDGRYCSVRCRVAAHRQRHAVAAESYVLTDEDRAAIARVMLEPTEGVPGLGPPLSPEAQAELAHRGR